jgi:hypothetical protein
MSVNDSKDIYLHLLKALVGGEEAAQALIASLPASSRTSISTPPEVFALQKLLTRANGGAARGSVGKGKAAGQGASGGNGMVVIILDEMDALITREQAVLYQLFELPELKHSRAVLIGVANSIDLTIRLLPRLQACGWEPLMITFPAYNAVELEQLLTQRLTSLPFKDALATVVGRGALQLCAKRVAAANGDMRKCLGATRTAFDILAGEAQAELKAKQTAEEEGEGEEEGAVAPRVTKATKMTISHMAQALNQLLKSPVAKMVQGLPQHAQLVLCAGLHLSMRSKKEMFYNQLQVWMDPLWTPSRPPYRPPAAGAVRGAVPVDAQQEGDVLQPAADFDAVIESIIRCSITSCRY